ncbi:MAG TPA: DUF1343 domain-containing protein [Phycisphaerae bacterium]|nr:DUF1343 domain-containing protein [Phycisphaerales bacterium]HRX85166.1 DUF1343 domain-containing protein [Phycisphaerae bacterium]
MRTLIAGLTGALLALAAGCSQPVQNGIDVLIAQDFAPLAGKRVGLITNPTGVDRDLRSTVDILHAADGVELVALYGPEHGVRGDQHAGDHVADAKDPVTGLPVFSLYGKTRKPTAEMLKGVDVLVFDIQDIGSRSYTYISTLEVAMEGAAEQGIDFVVLDRPNPLGGDRVEGRPLNMAYQSFVGHMPIPYVHGMTVGELAQMINGEGWLGEGKKCNLTVIPMRGWRRSMNFDATGLVWVPTSPHVPRADSSMFYAATGIMGELGVVNEGVGYPLPFELMGAPFLVAEAFASALNAAKMPGVHFRPTHYKPYYGSDKEEICHGVQIHLLEPDACPLTDIQFRAMAYVRDHHPDHPLFGAKRDAMFDKVCGTDLVRKAFVDGKPIDEILRTWHTGEDGFRNQRAKYLLYR